MDGTGTRRRRRWGRRLAITGIVVVVFVGTFWATRGLIVRRVVVGGLQDATGGEVSVRSVEVTGAGKVTVEDCEVRAPGVAGEGGVVFRAARIEAEVEWGSVLTGRPRVKRVVLERPMARLSQSVEDESLNVAGLRKPTGGGAVEVPQVVVRGGVVELGEHGAGEAYRALRRIPVAGEVAHGTDKAGGMRISFMEVDERGEPVMGPGAVQLTGVVGKDEVRLELGVVRLSSWGPESMPGPIREAYAGLALEGEVRDTTLTYRYDGAVSARARVEGVSLTLPVEVKPSENARGESVPVDPRDVGKKLRMRDVRGTVGLTGQGVEADLTGEVEGLKYAVELRTDGTSAEGAFRCVVRCDDLHLAQRPEVLKFAPGIVRRRLEQFSDPTGRVDAVVTIERAKAGAAVSVRGALTLRGMTAAFERFAYPFRNLAGRVTFDDERVVIERIEGEAPGGVRVTATGEITPITEDAKVRVDVKATGIPIDGTLRGAMAARGRLMDELFSEARHAELVEAGLITSGGKGAGPRFEMGGTIDVHALVTRDAGPGDDNWHDEVTITLHEARLLPEVVGYPIIARGATIVKKDHEAVVRGGTFTGLEGGSASVEARADLSALADPGAPFVPTIVVRASGVPVTRLLTHAVPAGAKIGDRAARDVLGAIAWTGEVELGAEVKPEGDGAAFVVKVTGSGLTLGAKGPGGAVRAQVRRAAVTAEVSESHASVAVRGVVGAVGEGAAGESPCEVRVEADRRREDGALHVEAVLPGLETRTRVEDFVRLSAAEAAGEIESLRARFAPAGRVSLRAVVSREEGGGIQTRVEASEAKEASFVVEGGRVTLPRSAGLVLMERTGEGAGVLRFAGFSAPARFEGQDVGTLTLDGPMGTDGGPADGVLKVGLAEGRFESPLVRAIAGASAPARLAGFFKDSDVRGGFDFEAAMSPRDGAEGRAWSAAGAVRPRSLMVKFGGVDVEFPRVRGAIEFGPGEGRVRDLVLEAPTWKVETEGVWVTRAGGETALTAACRVDASSLTPDLRAVMPEGVRRASEDLAAGVTGAVVVSPMTIALTYGADGALTSLKVEGRGRVEGASLDAGVEIERASGEVEFSALQERGASGVSFEVLGVMDRMAASGLEVSGARVRVVGLEDGRVLMPHFSAACHGGRVTGEAKVSAPGGNGKRDFEAEVRVSGARFASVLADYAATGASAMEEEPDGSRGLLDAVVTMGGTVGDVSSRRGRGVGAVSGGRVVNFPLLVPLVRMTNLQLPLNETVDYAEGEFYVRGAYLNFESLSVYSPSVEVVGYGTVTWPGMALDMRFRPRARSRIPLVTAVLEGIRDELMAVRAEGTLGKPVLAISALGGTSRFVGRLIGRERDEQERRLDAIEGRGRRGTVRREEAAPVKPGG
ncbi:MAG: hypothetical protein HBSAPP03_07240 [Phycisphaerae bacterium]|nr:MAG: hypothetical protein HBSAPP03_07240 [Phycisphaerae bacterium]